MKQLKYLALFGDIIFIFWIVYNGIDEGFKNIATIQGIVPLVLIVLLILNVTLLYKSK